MRLVPFVFTRLGGLIFIGLFLYAMFGDFVLLVLLGLRALAGEP